MVDALIKDCALECHEFSEFEGAKSTTQEEESETIFADWKTKDTKVVLRTIENPDHVNFANELQRYNDLEDEFVVRFYGVTKEPESGKYYMVLQHANQGNLREYLKTNLDRLDWDRKITMAQQIALGLKYLHDNRITHCDLHPCNILVHDDKVLVGGLGSTRSKGSKQSHTKKGTASHQGPQSSKRQHDEATNIYHLGWILWEISSGDSTIYMQKRKPKAVSGTPQFYEQLFKKCLDANAKKRPSINYVTAILGGSLSNNGSGVQFWKNFQDQKGQWHKDYVKQAYPRRYIAKDKCVEWLDESRDRYWRTVKDTESRYGKVVRLDHVWWFDVTPVLTDVHPGTYDVIWRLKVDKNHTKLDELRFCVEVVENNSLINGIFGRKTTKHEHVPGPTVFRGIASKRAWVEYLLPFKVKVTKAASEVRCTIYDHNNFTIKRGMSVDYVRLQPHLEGYVDSDTYVDGDADNVSSDVNSEIDADTEEEKDIDVNRKTGTDRY